MRGFFQAYPQLLDSGHAPRDLLAEMPEAPPLGAVQTKSHALRDQSTLSAQAMATRDLGVRGDWRPGHLHGALPWTHYRAPPTVSRRDARDFYEIEAVKNGKHRPTALLTRTVRLQPRAAAG